MNWKTKKTILLFVFFECLISFLFSAFMSLLNMGMIFASTNNRVVIILLSVFCFIFLNLFGIYQFNKALPNEK